MNDDTNNLARGRQAVDMLRGASLQFSASWISHKIAMYRDLSLVSAVILTGLIVFVGPDDVAWATLYYAAIAAFILVLVISAAAMRACVDAGRRRADACETGLARLSSAIRTMEVSTTPESASTLAAALGEGLGSEPAPGRLRSFAERACFWLFIAAVLGAFAGLMIDPMALGHRDEPGPDILTTSFRSSRV